MAAEKNRSELIKKSRKQWLIENVTSLGLALILVFMIRSSVIEAFKIPSGSMIPTLLVGDHIFVNKFAYGFKIPFSDWFFDEAIYIIDREHPQSGDIIVFKYPRDESTYYIKRVIGIPGDTVEIRNKRLYINGKIAAREAVPEENANQTFDSLDEMKYNRESLELYRESLGKENPVIMVDRNNFLGDYFGPTTVPDDHYFVMGDNRDYSNDSRIWGFVPFRNVKGKAMVIWLSLWVNLSADDKITFRPSRSGRVLQ
jgi:signal peptidase I